VTVQQHLNRIRLELRRVTPTRPIRLLLTFQDSFFSHRMPFLVESRTSTPTVRKNWSRSTCASYRSMARTLCNGRVRWRI